MNTLYYLLTCCCGTLYRIIFAWFAYVRPAAPLPFMAKVKRGIDTWSASVNLRRVRKAQRHAARSGDHFAFA